MKEANQAITPSAIDFIREIRNEEKVKEMDPVEASDRRLAALSEMEGWKELRHRIQNKIDNIRNLRDTDAIYEMSEAEIGKRFIVASLVTENLEWVLSMVEGPAKYYEEADGSTTNKE